MLDMPDNYGFRNLDYFEGLLNERKYQTTTLEKLEFLYDVNLKRTPILFEIYCSILPDPVCN